MRKAVVALAVVVGCTLLASPAWANHDDDFDCDDFDFHEEAVAHLAAHPDDPDGLDDNDDGVPCETLRSRADSAASGSGQALGAPRSERAARSESGLAQTGSSTVPLAAFGVGLILFGGLLVRAGYERVRTWSTTADTLTALERLFYRR